MSLAVVFVVCLVLGLPILATIGMATVIPIFLDG